MLAVLLTLALESLGVGVVDGVEGVDQVTKSTAPSAHAFLASQPAHLVEELFEKNVVLIPTESGSGASQGFRALVLFDRPASRTLRLLSQTARQKEFRPELSQLDRISDNAPWFIDDHVIKMLFVKIRYRVRSMVDFQQRRIEWELDRSVENDLRELRGFWQLYAYDERTVAQFGSITKIGAAIPTFLQDAITRRKLPRMLENCRRWINSDGRYRP